MRTQTGFSRDTPPNAPNTSRRDESTTQLQPMTATGKTGQTAPEKPLLTPIIYGDHYQDPLFPIQNLLDSSRFSLQKTATQSQRRSKVCEAQRLPSKDE